MNKLLIIVFLLGIRVLIAQPYVSKYGGFQVDQKEGCAPLTIKVELAGFNTFCTCVYSASGGGVSVGSGDTPFITFTNPGTYILKGNAQAGASYPVDSIVIRVNVNTLPDFEISSCNGNQVSIKVKTTQFDSYLVDFDNNSVVDATILAGGNQSANFNYGSSGSKTISVRGKDLNAANNCTPKLQTFTAIPTLTAPTINSLTVDNASAITLNYTPRTNYQYRAQISTNSASSFQQFQTFNSATATSQNLTLNSLAADDNYYCFRLNAYDPCNNGSVSSNIICSANFDVSATSYVDHLNWTTSSAGVLNYTIMRDNASLQTVNAMNFDDTNVICNTDYDYSIITNYANGSTSTSLTKMLTAFSDRIPDKIENTSAVVNGSAVDLNWEQPPGFTATSYTVFRNQSGGAFGSIATSILNEYTDNGYSTGAQFCYQLNYTDICANQSPQSDNICPIRLSGAANNLNQIQLSWSAYEGWDNGVKRYQVEKYDSEGTLLKSINTQDLSFLDNEEDPDNQIVEYRIKAIPRDAWLAESISNIIVIRRQARLVFPTAFTPNRDRLNDTFSVEGFYVESMKLQVFDRWGTLIFSTEANEPWDGTHNGKLMPESTYIWKAFITDKAGGEFSQIGSVALLRKEK